jgi:alpha-glucosidase (family GH31 glycosyl hydrolase)
MKKLILFFVCALSFAQNAERKFLSAKSGEDRVEVIVTDGVYRFAFYSDDIVETAFVPTGETENTVSHAIVGQPTHRRHAAVETDATLDFGTDGIAVHIEKSPFQIRYRYKNKPLVSEKAGYVKKDDGFSIAFNLDSSEALYGTGARAMPLNLRGNRLQLYNRAQYGYGDHAKLLNFTMPLVLSSKIYALHFDNAPIGWLDLDSKKDNSLVYESISGRKTYQVIAADSWIDLVKNYTELTGRQPLPPRWAFGNFASRFGYRSEKQVRDVVTKFEAENIPLDAVILDLYWFGKDIKGTLGNLGFDRDSFPNAEKMIADLNAKNIKTILITEPFILTTSKKWQEAAGKNILATDASGKPFTYDFYFGNTGLIDVFKPDARDWFWNVYKKYTQLGVGGWWGDLGEPEAHPSQARHATGTADEVHNIYGHSWAELVFEGYKRDFPDQRPFILMRSGYSGSQRFGMIPWSGDVGRSWGGLKSQLGISLAMGLQGMAYMHSDLGGFAGDNIDDELYVRWLQYGVFQPVFRPHAAEQVPPEPVFREETTKELAKKAVELRYKLLPYNYTLAFQNESIGAPLMRPLFFEEPENEALRGKSDSYLWGGDFLVAPVVEAGQKGKEVYFPKSSDWIDFYTGQRYTGGSTHTVATAPDHIPVFVRGGAIIAMCREAKQTASYDRNLELHYYHDPKAENGYKCLIYEDDGTTPDAFLKARYEITDVTIEKNKKSIELGIYSVTGADLKSRDRTFKIVAHGMPKPVKILFNGKKIGFTYDAQTKETIFEVVHAASAGPKTYNEVPYPHATVINIAF